MSDICNKCGQQLIDGASFCGSCGHKIGSKASSARANPAASTADQRTPTQSASPQPKIVEGINWSIVLLKAIGIIAVWIIAGVLFNPAGIIDGTSLGGAIFRVFVFAVLGATILIVKL